MKRSKKKRIRQMELQEAKHQAWMEEHKDDEWPFEFDGFGAQMANPKDYILKKILEERRENLSPDQRMMIALLTKPDDLSFI